MRIITKEYKILTYNELDEKAKEKSRQWYLNNREAYVFTDSLIEDLKDEFGLSNLRPYYSLNYCQGDGLCLAGHIDFKEIKKEMKPIFFKDFTLTDYRALKELKAYSRIDFNHSGCYYHKHSVDIDIYIDGKHSVKMYNFIEKTANKLISNIEKWYLDTCDRYKKWGYDYFYEVQENELKEYFNDMDIEFYEDGSIFEGAA